MRRERFTKSPLMGIIVVLLMFNVASGWFFSSDSEHDKGKKKSEAGIVPKKQVPFEMQTADEKFLMEAKFAGELSPLDLCHHMVVAEITSTCSDLSEEELNKLAVMLLNCQSQSENRPTFPCSQDMTIAECTSDMDPTTWNAYQIVANRARAICYSTRQQQFRMKTERTVNELISNTMKQADTVMEIQSHQEAVASASQDTLRQVREGQEELREQQSKTSAAHDQLHSSVALNLRHLAREKALIAAGHSDLAHMTQDIRRKLDETSAQLEAQSKRQEENHDHVASSLDNIHSKAHHVLNKIDESSQSVKDLHNETERHYQNTMHNLEKVNNTINYALSTLEDFRKSVELKLNWLLALVGGAGDRVERLWTVILHIVYFLLAMVSASFLRTPLFSRLLLMLLVPLNAWSQLRHQRSLAFLPMTLFILLTVVANWLTAWLMYITTSRWRHKSAATPLMICESPQRDNKNDNKSDGDKKSHGLSTPDVHRLIETLEKLYEAGVLSPQVRNTTPPEPSNPANTPAAATRNNSAKDQASEKADHFIKQNLLKSEFRKELSEEASRPIEDPFTPFSLDLKATARDSPRLSVVKRHLLKSVLATPPGSPSHNTPLATPPGSPALTPDDTPTGSATNTPPPSPTTSTPIKGYQTPLRNLSRPQCLAVTLSGLPCKNSSMEGSGFCHRHQTTPLKGTPGRKGTPAKGTPAKGTPSRGTPAKGTPLSQGC